MGKMQLRSVQGGVQLGIGILLLPPSILAFLAPKLQNVQQPAQ